ncbi:unnamed protein product [Mycena citricolor]|uniref:L-ornithine N(5)-oxygenase n=1 Tax=Mycena citricolor TaxID=2018698 RepID=A0AAD2Q1H5_9AGAR|nr:unnamed protein product [Mycena citricolor]
MSRTTASPGVAAPDPAARQKYIEERNKRLRADGASQFVRLSTSDAYKHLEADPWVDHAALNAAPHVLTDGESVKFLILGAGYGGLVFAARLVQAGFSPSDIRFVDVAGGFGGTWYWNRYPGLMCDVESYIYMPLLEETGYMPKHKYAYGNELRAHADRIAERYGLLEGTGSFRTQYHDAKWDEEARRWQVRLSEYRGPQESSRSFSVSAQFVFVAAGTLVAPQVPVLPGLEQFKGSMFHTARWDYDVTGGSFDDWSLEKLKDKRVAIIGTGATAIQVVPELAKWAKHLYVIQRTPSSVDERGQRPTDPKEWKEKVAVGKGWQYARSMNFNSQLMNAPDGEDLVSDAWCRSDAYCGIIGAPGLVTPDTVPQHVEKLHAMDFPRAERVRDRVSQIVRDPETAEKLKAWYPVWCKRPTFHEDYLPAFNQPNVTLVDTDGKGVDSLTPTAIVANGIEHPIDVLVLSTGFVSPAAGTGSPATRGGLSVFGRNGRDMEKKWIEEGCGTFHGVSSNGYPNLFFPSPSQAGVTVNFTFSLDLLANHVAGILAEAHRGLEPEAGKRLVVEVDKQAEEMWAGEILQRAAWFAGVSGCTPGYINLEGERDRPQDMAEQVKSARGAPWGDGIVSFVGVLEKWRAEGGLKGFIVST